MPVKPQNPKVKTVKAPPAPAVSYAAPASASISLPKEVEAILYSVFGTEDNIRLASEFGLTVGQLADMTRLINDLYFKRAQVAEIEKQLIGRLSLADAVAKKMAIEVLGRRLLIADKLLFNGEVAQKIKALGGNVSSFQPVIEQYQRVIQAEAAAAVAEAVQEEKEKAKRQAAAQRRKALEDAPLAIKDPEAEKESAKRLFANEIKEILVDSSLEVRLELNARAIILLLQDELGVFQKSLLDALYNNHELLTANKLISKKESLDPTIGNWLKDYIQFSGVEEAASTIKKAQYFTQSENVRKLSAEEKGLLDKLLDLYVNVRRFYVISQKIDVTEIQIFSLTEEEVASLNQATSQEGEETEEKSSAEEAVDISRLYAGTLEERTQVEAEKKRIISLTRKEYNKVADLLDEYILRRQRYGIMASLETLAESGALDDVFSGDARFQKLLLGYFQRNNLPAAALDFPKNPRQPKYLKYFLQYLFLERLGLADAEGARIAARLSNIFRQQGRNEFARLAYFDLKDKRFKWSE